MPLIAIPGGTSPTLGRSIVTALLASGKHTVVILSRATQDQNDSSASTAPSKEKYGASITYVDYGSRDSLTSALHGVFACISVLKIPDPEATTAIHTNLLNACIAAGVRRFAPSEWTYAPKAFPRIPVLHSRITTWEDACAPAMERGEIECGRFACGAFVNYFGWGCEGLPEKIEDALQGLDDDLMVEYADVRRGVLSCPVNQEDRAGRFNVVDIRDIGTYVVGSLDMESWNGVLAMGEVVTVRDIEKVLREKCAWKGRVTDISRQELQTKIDGFEAKLKQGFDMAAFRDKLMAELMAVIADDEEGGAYCEPVLTKYVDKKKIRSMEQYLVDVWG